MQGQSIIINVHPEVINFSKLWRLDFISHSGCAEMLPLITWLNNKSDLMATDVNRYTFFAKVNHRTPLVRITDGQRSYISLPFSMPMKKEQILW